MFLPAKFSTDRMQPLTHTWGMAVNDIRDEPASKLARLEVENKQLRAAMFEVSTGLSRAIYDLRAVRHLLQPRRWVIGAKLMRTLALYAHDAERSLQIYNDEKHRADAARTASRAEVREIAEHTCQASFG